MNNNIILHIPHSSTNVHLMEGYSVDKNSLTNEMLKMTYLYIDDLFYSNEDEMIQAEFSRIFYDHERLTDDSNEIMAQFRMGVRYEKNDDGQVIRKVTPEFKLRVLNAFYWPHHGKLKAVDN